MKSPTDPFDQLRAANPVGPEDVPSPDSEQGRAILARVVERAPEVERRPSPRTRRGLLILVPALAVLGLGAAFAVLREVRDPLTVACYREPTLDSREIALLETDGRDPVAICSALWRPGGEFGREAARPVPPLVACVLDSGMVGVFPATGEGEVCADLGLIPPDVDPAKERQNTIIVDMVKRLTRRVGPSCLSERQAHRVARAEIERAGLDGWTVVSSRRPFTQKEPCASLAIDVPKRTVTLVPIGRH